MNSSRVTAFGSVVYDSETVENGTVVLDKFLVAILGPRQMPMSWLVPVTLFYSLVFATGTAGTISV